MQHSATEWPVGTVCLRPSSRTALGWGGLRFGGRVGAVVQRVEGQTVGGAAVLEKEQAGGS
jgi:hypothetical protein